MGTKSNRDAIGAAVTVETAASGQPPLRQTKYLQAGSGFLSQHTKELFFGVGRLEGTVRATIRWPSGLTQVFEHLPVNQRIEIEEGSAEFAAKPFASSSPFMSQAGEPPKLEPLPSIGRNLADRSIGCAGFFPARPRWQDLGVAVVPRWLSTSQFLDDGFAFLRGAVASSPADTRRTSASSGLHVVRHQRGWHQY